MRIVVTGGTGFIGKALCRYLLSEGHRVTVLTRNLAQAWRMFGAGPELLQWDGAHAGDWEHTLEDADAVVNLAGASIADAWWTPARKRLLIESRVAATRALVEGLSRRARRRVVLVNASGIGYYGASEGGRFDETAPRGGGFLADLSAAWESEASRAESFGVRVVRLRLGMVLERDGGALPRMLLPFRLGVGGPISPGTQWVSWIHRDDLIRLIGHTATNESIAGAVNAVAPEVVTMKEFCRTLGHVMHRPSWLSVPEFALKLGLGELGSLLTTGQYVIPAKALASGFSFSYADLESALQAILRPHQAAHRTRSAPSRSSVSDRGRCS
ncbi:epimerase [Nitrospira sp.]|nr:epimerase [Nitrospira sp.]